MPQVYIVILNYKKWRDTQECLESLMLSSSENFSVIVIDNDSQNNSLRHLMDWAKTNVDLPYIHLKGDEIDEPVDPTIFPRLTFIQNISNAGFAGGINPILGFLRDTDAFVWLLNPDMVVEKNTLSELIRFIMDQPAKCIVGTQVLSYGGNHELLFYGGGMINFHSGTIRLCKKINDIPKLDFISGGSLLTHASNFKKLGLLPEKYFLYWEDTDWTYMARQEGYDLKVCTTAICYDKISSVIGKGFLGDYYYARNGLLFLKKYKPKNISTSFFFMIFRFIKRIITGRWKRAGGIWSGTMDYFKLQQNESK